jgi:uncharacterized protein (TIGR00725 family)
MAEPRPNPPDPNRPPAPPLRIGVLGPHECSPEEQAVGAAVGAGIARRGGLLICGGLGGMMEAAARGAREAGGRTLGLLPGEDDSAANPYIEIPLPTGLGALRNALIVRVCHAVIAIYGGYGTLSELAFALRLKVPAVGLDSWSVVRKGQVDPGIHPAATAEEAVALAFALAEARPRPYARPAP